MNNLDPLKQPYLIPPSTQTDQNLVQTLEMFPDKDLGSISPDDYIREMIHLNLMDPETFKLTEEALKMPLPELSEVQYQFIQHTLDERFPLEKNALANTQDFKDLQLRGAIGLSLEALMKSGQFDEASFIGSAVPFLLGVSFFKQWCDIMLRNSRTGLPSEFCKKIETCPSDLDVRFKVKKSSKKLSDLKKLIPHFLQDSITSSNSAKDLAEYLQKIDPKTYQYTDSETGNLLREVLKEGYLLKYAYINQESNKFVVTTLGSADFSLEIIAAESLERNFLFTRDDLQLSFKEIHNLSKIELKSEASPHQAISDLLAGIIRPHRLVSGKDWIAQIHLMIRGNRCIEKGTEKKLYEALSNGGKIPCEQIIDEMNKRLAVHSAKDDFAAIAAAFQLCTSMNFFSAAQSDIETVWKGICENRKPPREGLLYQIFEALKKDIPFEEILSCVELGSFIVVNTSKKNSSVTLSNHEGPAIRIRLKGTPYFLWHRFNPTKALLNIVKKETLKPELQSILKTFYELSLEDPIEKSPFPVPIENLTTARDTLIQKPDLNLATLGIVLHRVCQTFEKTSSPDLLRKIPFLLSQSPFLHTRKTICEQLSAHDTSLKFVFDKLSPQIESINLHKDQFCDEWIIAVAGTTDSALSNSAIYLARTIKDENRLIPIVEKVSKYPSFALELLLKHKSIPAPVQIKTLSQICEGTNDPKLNFAIKEVISRQKESIPLLNINSGSFLKFAERLESIEKYPFIRSIEKKGLLDKSLFFEKIKGLSASLCKEDETAQNEAIDLICQTLNEKEVFQIFKIFASTNSSLAIRLLSNATQLDGKNRMTAIGFICTKSSKFPLVDLKQIQEMLGNQQIPVSLGDEKTQLGVSRGLLSHLEELSGTQNLVQQLKFLSELEWKGLIHKEHFLKKSQEVLKYCIFNEPKSLLEAFSELKSLDLALSEDEWIEATLQLSGQSNPKALLLINQLTQKLITSKNPKAFAPIQKYFAREIKSNNGKICEQILASALPENEKNDLRICLIEEKLNLRAFGQAIHITSEIDYSKLSKESLQSIHRILSKLIQSMGKTKEFTVFWSEKQVLLLEALRVNLNQEALDLLSLASDHPLKIPQDLFLDILLKGWEGRREKSIELFQKKILPFELLPSSISSCLEIGEKLITENRLDLAEKLEKKLTVKCNPKNFIEALIENEITAKNWVFSAELILKWHDVCDAPLELHKLVIELSGIARNSMLAIDLIKAFQITEKSVLEKAVSKINEKTEKKFISALFPFIIPDEKHLLAFNIDLQTSFGELPDLDSETEELYLSESFKNFRNHPLLKVFTSAILFKKIQNTSILEKNKALIKQYLELTKDFHGEAKDPPRIHIQNVRLLRRIADNPDFKTKDLRKPLEAHLEKSVKWILRERNASERLSAFAVEIVDLLLMVSRKSGFVEDKEKYHILAVDILRQKNLIPFLKPETYLEMSLRLLASQDNITPSLYLLENIPIDRAISCVNKDLIQGYLNYLVKIYCALHSNSPKEHWNSARNIFFNLFDTYIAKSPGLETLKKDLTLTGKWLIDGINEMPLTDGGMILLSLYLHKFNLELKLTKKFSKPLCDFNKDLLITVLRSTIPLEASRYYLESACKSLAFDEMSKYETQVALAPTQFLTFQDFGLTKPEKQKLVTALLNRILNENPTNALLKSIELISTNSIKAGLFETLEEVFGPDSNLPRMNSKILELMTKKSSSHFSEMLDMNGPLKTPRDILHYTKLQCENLLKKAALYQGYLLSAIDLSTMILEITGTSDLDTAMMDFIDLQNDFDTLLEILLNAPVNLKKEDKGTHIQVLHNFVTTMRNFAQDKVLISIRHLQRIESAFENYKQEFGKRPDKS